MANREHLKILRQGIDVWNEWRKQNPKIKPDLSKAKLREAILSDTFQFNPNFGRSNVTQIFKPGVGFRGPLNQKTHPINLSEVNLTDADLSRAHLREADLSSADLRNAILDETNLCGAKLCRANLEACGEGTVLMGADLSSASLESAVFRQSNLMRAKLVGANLNRAHLSQTKLIQADLRKAKLKWAFLDYTDFDYADLNEADLEGADLRGASLINANLSKANLTNSKIFGVPAWEINLDGAIQKNLIITKENEPTITVDNLEIAQFIYLLLNNEKIRDVIDTIGKKGVLILGRFTPERKLILDTLREELRRLDYVPMLFDFERPTQRDFSETIITLTGMCRFVIVDITNPKSSLLELQGTVPNCMIPFVPIIQEGEKPFSMFVDLKNKFDWVLDTLVYDSVSSLVKGLEKAVIKPALEKHSELMAKKAEVLRTRHIKNYL